MPSDTAQIFLSAHEHVLSGTLFFCLVLLPAFFLGLPGPLLILAFGPSLSTLAA